jgi:hypothetical protein
MKTAAINIPTIAKKRGFLLPSEVPLLPKSAVDNLAVYVMNCRVPLP